MNKEQIKILIFFPFQFFIHSILFLFKKIYTHFKKIYISEQIYFLLTHLVILFGSLPWGKYSIEIFKDDFLYNKITNDDLFLLLIGAFISLIPCYIIILSPKVHSHFSYWTKGIIFLSRIVGLIILGNLFYKVYQNPTLISHYTLMKFTIYFYTFGLSWFILIAISIWSLIQSFIHYKDNEIRHENIY